MDLRNYLFLSGRLPGVLPRPINGNPLGPGGGAPMGGAPPFPGQQWKQAGPLTPPAPLPPPKGRGFLGSIDDVFGGPDMKNLTPEQQKAARRRGLLAFGAQMLTATDPRGNRAQGLSALGQGVMAAQGGYGQGIEQGMAQNAAQQEAQMWAQLQPQPGENIQQTYARLQAMLAAAMQAGKPQLAQTIAGVLQTLPTLMKDKGAEAPLTPWGKEGFSSQEEYFKFLRGKTNATQRPFAPRTSGSRPSGMPDNEYFRYLGQQADDLRGEIAMLKVLSQQDEAEDLSRELRRIMDERAKLAASLPGAPTATGAPINPVTGVPFAKQYSPGNPFRVQ